MAFDPETDNPEFLRTVVIMLRASALAASTRTGATEIATAEEKISEALDQLTKIDEIKKSAGLITKHAEKIDSQADCINIGVRRLLDQALSALAGAAADSEPGAPRSRGWGGLTIPTWVRGQAPALGITAPRYAGAAE
jgi:hypothetical protein